MVVEADGQHGLTDNYALVVGSDGTCVLHPQLPQLVGEKPWDWCVMEDRPDCRERFIRACMFREDVQRFECRIQHKGAATRVSMQLFPLGRRVDSARGEVLCTYHRVFDVDLTARERDVLQLLASGVSLQMVADTLMLSPSTIRDHTASLKRKLRVDSMAGLSAAARQFGSKWQRSLSERPSS